MQRLETTTLLTLRTNLRDIDRRWLQVIEPKIFRPKTDHEAFGCWLWTGWCDAKGEPTIGQENPGTKKRGTRRLKKLVAEIFVPGWQESWNVYHDCGNINCLNPNHMIFTKSHHTQFDLGKIVARKRTHLKDYRNELLREAAKPE
jgi:hypothetical protein